MAPPPALIRSSCGEWLQDPVCTYAADWRVADTYRLALDEADAAPVEEIRAGC
jgi:hypothetical protein